MFARMMVLMTLLAGVQDAEVPVLGDEDAALLQDLPRWQKDIAEWPSIPFVREETYGRFARNYEEGAYVNRFFVSEGLCRADAGSCSLRITVRFWFHDRKEDMDGEGHSVGPFDRAARYAIVGPSGDVFHGFGRDTYSNNPRKSAPWRLWARREDGWTSIPDPGLAYTVTERFMNYEILKFVREELEKGQR